MSHLQLTFPVIEMLVSDRKPRKWYTSSLEKANARLHIAHMRETLNKINEEKMLVGCPNRSDGKFHTIEEPDTDNPWCVTCNVKAEPIPYSERSPGLPTSSWDVV